MSTSSKTVVREPGPHISGHISADVRRWDEKTKSYGDWIRVDDHDNLVTNAGKDFFFQQCYQSTGIATSGANWVGVTTSVFTPANTDVSLTGEMTTLGFSRAQVTGANYAHTAGTNTATLTITFTASGAATNVQAGAIFTLAGPPVSGQMCHEFTFTPTTFAINDQLQLTITVTYT